MSNAATAEKQPPTDSETDFVFCRNCQHVEAIVDGNICANCGMMVCVFCGCTENAACGTRCYWVRPGVCSECD